MHIQCERILLSQVNSTWPQKELFTNQRRPAILGNWYAKILTFLQSEFLVIVHNQSLLTLVEFLDLSSPDSFHQVFTNVRGKISEILQEYYFLSDNQLTELLNSFSVVTFGQIEDQNFAPVMQVITKIYQRKFLQAKQKAKNGEIRLWEIEENLNKIPRRELGGISPLETIRELVRSGLN